jgi:hypothetical protein
VRADGGAVGEADIREEALVAAEETTFDERRGPAVDEGVGGHGAPERNGIGRRARPALRGGGWEGFGRAFAEERLDSATMDAIGRALVSR